MDYPPLWVVRFRGETLNEGAEMKLIEGIPVQINNVPKPIADCFKFRNKIGLDVELVALKEVWRDKRVNMDDLWHYARLCRVQNVMRDASHMTNHAASVRARLLDSLSAESEVAHSQDDGSNTGHE